MKGGFVRGLVAVGNSLYAVAEVAADFVDLVREGRLLAVSASFFKPEANNNPMPGIWFLRHVGFLGAVPPAVKGLERMDFSELPADFADQSHTVRPQDGFAGCLHAALTLPGLSYMECVGLAQQLAERSPPC